MYRILVIKSRVLCSNKTETAGEVMNEDLNLNLNLIQLKDDEHGFRDYVHET